MNEVIRDMSQSPKTHPFRWIERRRDEEQTMTRHSDTVVITDIHGQTKKNCNR